MLRNAIIAFFVLGAAATTTTIALVGILGATKSPGTSTLVEILVLTSAVAAALAIAYRPKQPRQAMVEMQTV